MQSCDRCGFAILKNDPKFKMDDGDIVCTYCCYREKGDVKEEYEVKEVVNDKTGMMEYGEE